MGLQKKGEAVVFQIKGKIFYQITSKISYGNETMVFQGSYDISEVYTTRHEQLVSFRKYLYGSLESES